MNFSGWILSVVGIVILALVVDIILPEGQTNKYIKSIFAIITVFVIVTPLPGLLKNDVQLDIFENSSEVLSADSQILNSLWQIKANEIEKNLIEIFDENNIKIKDLQVFFDENSDDFQIKKVEINIEKSVIANEDKNINIKDKAKKLAISNLQISADKVFVYE